MSRGKCTISPCLLGYGVSAINPYLAFATIGDLIDQGLLSGDDYHKSVATYIKAAMKGVLKVLGKMGISTIQGYQGAQIFEAVGLHQSVIDKYFTWTPSSGGRRRAWTRSRVRRRCVMARPSGRGRIRPRQRRPLPVATRRGVPSLQSRDHS